MKVFKYKDLIINLEEVSSISTAVDGSEDTRRIIFHMKNGEYIHSKSIPTKDIENFLNIIYIEMTTGE